MSDDEKRSLYDKYGEAGLKGAGMGMGVSIGGFVMEKANASINFLQFSIMFSIFVLLGAGFQQSI